ncbi:MAG TPA: VOC family protein [Chloroflexota bacterium]|nr:VOC family protein [Chloroflexota bacterium]
MARIMGLGHVGIFVRDLERMAAFYRDVMGMTLTKQNWRSGIVFFSADPDAVDHEIALVRGRPENDNPKLIHQISLRVDSLDGLREFHRRLIEADCKIDRTVCHGSAFGCYFFDPEGNTTEVFWVTGRPCWVPTSEPVDLEQPDEVLMAVVDRIIEREGHVPMGGLKPETAPVPV